MEGVPYENRFFPNKITDLLSTPIRRSFTGSYPSSPVKPKRTSLKRSDRSVSDTNIRGIHTGQWAMSTKKALSEATTVSDIKPHLITLLDKVSHLESELKVVQRERNNLQKELDSMRKQRLLPSAFKSISTILTRGNSSSPANKDVSHHRTQSPRSPKATTRRKSTIGMVKGATRRSSEWEPSDEVEDRTRRRRSQSFSYTVTSDSMPCLTMRHTNVDSGGGGGKNGSSIDANGDANDNPSLDEIRTWARSFDTLMSTARGRRKFREFLRSEYSEENLLFWLACEELHKEVNKSTVEEKARLIYEDYISILSPKEVSLDSRTREVVNRNMTEPSPTTFDEAQEQIYILMHRDSFPRFVNSKMFRNLLEKASQDE